jgi:GT2 family glycosyltransferase
MSSFITKLKKLIKAINFRNIKSIFKYIRYHGFKGLFGTCINYIRFGKAVLDEYATWISNNEPDAKELEKQKKYKSNIKFEFVIEEKQERLIQSMENQTYSNWSINENKDILKNTDSDYIVFVGKNIELTQFALYEFVKAINKKEAIVYYSDNDLKIEEKRKEPDFKPDFAIDTLLSKNYIGNMVVVKTEFLRENSELLENLKEEIYYNLLLRIETKTNNIIHISKILYHELIENKEINTNAQKEAIKQYLQTKQILFKEIKDGRYEGNYKIEYEIKGNPKVSLVVPNKDHLEDLDKLIKSVEKSTYQNYEMVIVENNSEKKETFDYYKQITQKNPKIKIEKYEIKYFNYSSIVNFGVEKSSGEYVILLNNDIEILTPDWIEQMLMYVQRKDTGLCGIKLYFPDRSIQHAGVTIGTRGLAGHRARETEEKDFKENDYINIVQDLSAVTAACFMVEKSLYEELSGFDEKLAVAFNDVDFCLKVRTAKYLVVYNPFVEAYHYESKSRGEDTQTPEKQKRFAKEYELFVKRWSKVIAKGDPYYNKNYRLDTDLPKINYNKVI